MNNHLYNQLGFKQPKFVQNSFGIRIYLGTEDQDDWCVVIPKELVKLKHSHYNYDTDYAMYLISEKEALEVAKKYTELAKGSGGMNYV